MHVLLTTLVLVVTLIVLVAIFFLDYKHARILVYVLDFLVIAFILLLSYSIAFELLKFVSQFIN